MDTVIDFIVRVVPVAQPRQRSTRLGHNYTPARHPVQAYKATLRLALQAAYQLAPLRRPVRLETVYVLPRPQSLCWKTRPMPRLPHAKQKDLDNLDKSTMDALTGLAWANDGQVFSKKSTKWIAAGDEAPHVHVVITESDDE